MTPADLRAARQRLDLTQEGLADALRLGKGGKRTVSGWEREQNSRGIPGPVQVALELMLKADELERAEIRYQDEIAARIGL